MSNKIITLTIAGKDYRFTPDVQTYNKYINEMTMSNKIAPAHNFLSRTVMLDDKDDLLELLKRPGAVLQIVGRLLDEYTPELEITVKN